MAAPGRLVLHLGDFKTGSTAIQHWLAQAGAAAGIATPPGFNQAGLAHSLTGDAPGAEAAFAALRQSLEGRQEPFLVISAEHFEMAPPERLARMLSRHLPDLAETARAVVYIRPHPGAYLARFAESVKIGSHRGGLESYLDRPDIPRRLAYGTRLASWRAVFGARLTVRLYDPAALLGGDVVRDFAAFVTGRDPGPQARAFPANPSPGLHDLAWLTAFHAALGDLPPQMQGARFTLGREVGRALAARRAAEGAAADPPLRLHRALALRLAERLSPEAARADAEHFRDTALGAPLGAALARACAEAPETAQDLAPEHCLDARELADIRLWAGIFSRGFARPGAAGMIDGLWHE